MADIAAKVNGERTAPTVGGDEYDLFLSALQSAENTWEGSDYDFPQLRFVYRTTLGTSGTSVALPDDFKKLSGYVLVGGLKRIAIDPKDEPLNSTGSEYVAPHVAEGYLAINPASATTTTVDVYYQARATSLATSTAIPYCPSDEYLINKASSILLFGRTDPRYTELRDEADLLLQQMVGSDMSKLKGTESRVTSSAEEQGFTLGVD